MTFSLIQSAAYSTCIRDTVYLGLIDNMTRIINCTILPEVPDFATLKFLIKASSMWAKWKSSQFCSTFFGFWLVKIEAKSGIFPFWSGGTNLFRTLFIWPRRWCKTESAIGQNILYLKIMWISFIKKPALESWHICLEVINIEKCCQKQCYLESHFFSRLY